MCREWCWIPKEEIESKRGILEAIGGGMHDGWFEKGGYPLYVKVACWYWIAIGLK